MLGPICIHSGGTRWLNGSTKITSPDGSPALSACEYLVQSMHVFVLISDTPPPGRYPCLNRNQAAQKVQGRNQAAQASTQSISHRQGCLSREASKCVTVVAKEPWGEPGRASTHKPNFSRALLPLKGSFKVCNCRHKGALEAARPRKQVQT